MHISYGPRNGGTLTEHGVSNSNIGVPINVEELVYDKTTIRLQIYASIIEYKCAIGFLFAFTLHVYIGNFSCIPLRFA